jgi:alanyl-tRNA synthetase
VLADEPVSVNWIPLAVARKIPGVRAVFGEKYPDPVRVVSVAAADPLQDAGRNTPVEFCGGTHVERTGQIGFFKVVSEESVARGVRRVTAVTGREAVRYVQGLDQAARSAAQALRVPVEQIPQRIAALQAEVKQLRKQRGGGAGEALQADVLETPKGKVVIAQVQTADPAAMRGLCDVQRQRGAAAVLVGSAEEGKVTLIAMVSDELVKAGQVKAGDWVKAAASAIGGSGGGKPTLAQAGGKDPARLPEALQAGKEWIAGKLAGA